MVGVRENKPTGPRGFPVFADFSAVAVFADFGSSAAKTTTLDNDIHARVLII